MKEAGPRSRGVPVLRSHCAPLSPTGPSFLAPAGVWWAAPSGLSQLLRCQHWGSAPGDGPVLCGVVLASTHVMLGHPQRRPPGTSPDTTKCHQAPGGPRPSTAALGVMGLRDNVFTSPSRGPCVCPARHVREVHAQGRAASGAASTLLGVAAVTEWGPIGGRDHHFLRQGRGSLHCSAPSERALARSLFPAGQGAPDTDTEKEPPNPGFGRTAWDWGHRTSWLEAWTPLPHTVLRSSRGRSRKGRVSGCRQGPDCTRVYGA